MPTARDALCLYLPNCREEAYSETRLPGPLILGNPEGMRARTTSWFMVPRCDQTTTTNEGRAHPCNSSVIIPHRYRETLPVAGRPSPPVLYLTGGTACLMIAVLIRPACVCVVAGSGHA